MASHAAVAPLIKTQWNQGSTTETGYIYNTQTPIINGRHALTGCVATAGAQIMYYYQHPKAPTKAVPGYKSNNTVGTLPSLPSTTFNWSAMKTTYNKSDVGTAAETAVSTLMLYCGYAAQMSYGLGGSSANEGVLAQAMAELFDYDPYTFKSIDREAYSVAEWDALIYNELAEGRPMIFGGSTWTNEGHAFLCDGYDGAGLYHFNWGWGGYCDGYFRLHVTNPDFDDDPDSYGVFSSGYVIGTTAIIGLQPNTGVVPDDADIRVARVYESSISGTKISMGMGNPYSEAQGFGYGIAEVKADGSLTLLDGSYSKLLTNQLQQGQYYILNFNVSKYSLPNGTHTLVPVSMRNGDETWRHCMPFNLGFLVIVNGSDITIKELPIVGQPAVTQISFTGSKIATVSQSVVATVSSSGGEYIKPLYLFASTSSSSKGSAKYCVSTAIEDGQTEDVIFQFRPSSAGRYYIWITTDLEGTDVIGTSSVDIAEVPTGTVVLEITDRQITCQPDGKVTYQITVKNTGNVTNYNGFYVYLWAPKDGNMWSVIDSQSVPEQIIEPGASATISFTFEGLTDGNEYSFEPYYYTTFQKEQSLSFNDYFYTDRFTYQSPMSGDLDGDGVITDSDVECLIELMLNADGTSILGDIDGNGRISISDVTALIKKMLDLK